MAAAGTITVKLHLDTTEFFAELARVREAILELEGLGGDTLTEQEKFDIVDRLKQGGSIAPRISGEIINTHRIP